MTHTKKWILTLVLIAIILPIRSVNAATYTARDDTVISTQYYQTFENYFGSDSDFRYFAYRCFTNRTCYYAIDTDNNYIDITYLSGGSSYTTTINTGVDDNFNVSGLVYHHQRPYYNYYFSFIIVGITLFVLIFVRLKHD